MGGGGGEYHKGAIKYLFALFLYSLKKKKKKEILPLCHLLSLRYIGQK